MFTLLQVRVIFIRSWRYINHLRTYLLTLRQQSKHNRS